MQSGNWTLAAFLSILAGVVHVGENYVYLRHLEKLPNRDYAAVAALQTENSFYYSYFSELVDAESAAEGLKNIVWDRRTEYPDVLNAIRRFNVYQEVVLGLEFRALRSLGLPLPHPFDFFKYHIWVLNGVGQASMSLLAAEISGNPLASVACLLSSFLNRFQISRLGNYSTSDLREIWGIPILWVQTYLLWRLILSSRRGPNTPGSWLLWLSFGATTFAFIVSWQFSPFLLLLQATALYFVLLVAGWSSLRPLVLSIVHTYFLALLLAVLVHFGSPYLLTSPFFFQLAAFEIAFLICAWRQPLLGIPSWRQWLGSRLMDVVEGLLAVLGFVLVRKVMAPFATADTHVYEILCTKVSAINDLLPTWMQLAQSQLPACAEPGFNAQLYLIMGVFKLLEWSSIKVYADTSALQAAAASCLLVFVRSMAGSARTTSLKSEAATTPAMAVASKAGAAADGPRKRKGQTMPSPPVSGDKSRGSSAGQQTVPTGGKRLVIDQVDEAESAAMLFFVVQFLLFFLLGCLVNRLRVAFGPTMMVLAATATGPKLWPSWLRSSFPKLLPLVLFGAFTAHMLWMGSMLPCVTEKEGICQHFADKSTHDGDLVDLYDWINTEVKPGTPVLASMNLAGSMRSFTHVPMVIHPQFESENLRSRVQRAYELYNCGSEASFAETVAALKASLVIFETSRCFFTPYVLDDKRKNCNRRKHWSEDQLCLKLHGRSRRFKLVFINGNYAVFKLRKKVLPLAQGASEPKAADIKAWLDERETWKDYVQECEKTQGAHCGPRLMEAAASFHHGLKKTKMAAALRSWAEKLFPDDGYVNYYLARFYDVDAGQPQKAKQYYDKALKLLPNNPKVLVEVILFYDLVLQDASFSASLLERRSKARDGLLPLWELPGTATGLLLCEAAAAAKQAGNIKLASKLWKGARKRSPLNECVRNNWPIINDEKSQEASSYHEHYSLWSRVKMLAAGGANIEIGPHHQANARFLGGVDFVLWPPKNKTKW